MPPRARYRPDIKGFGRVLASKKMQEEMRDRAEQVAVMEPGRDRPGERASPVSAAWSPPCRNGAGA